MTTVADLRKKTPLQDVMKQPPKQRIATLLQENKREIAAALPKHINIDRMLTIAQTAATSVPALLECYTPSLFGAMIKCTQLGLEPNNALGQAYLVPFRNRKQNRKDVQLIIGYKGLIDLARRSGHVVSINAQAVREGDEFEWEFGLNERLVHRPGKERGEITHFYAYAKLTGGGHQFDVQTVEDIIKLMKTTQSKGEYGPWADHFEAMGRKSMIRKISSYLPLSIQQAEASALDGRADAGLDQGLEGVLSGDYTVLPDQDAPESLPAPIADVNGEVFDPELHQADAETGEPIYNKDQSFRKKRAKPAAKPTEPDQTQAAPANALPDDAPPTPPPGGDDAFNIE
jgi:recombination protein RecT